MAGMEAFTTLVFYIIVLFFLAFLLIAFFISVKMFQRISELIDVVDNPATVIEKNIKSGEVEYIAEKIMNTIQSNQFLTKEMEERLISLNNMEASALGAQINHHFLYNTLDTIKWKAYHTCEDKSIVALITSLSELYKICAINDTHLVSISNEVEHSKRYIDILKSRYNGNLTVNWNIDQEVLNLKIVRLCLQPLIENAYYHGIKPKRMPGIIDINGKAYGDYIEIEVKDNGIGIDEFNLNRINESLLTTEIHGFKHIGIRNVNARIKLVMGHDYGLTLSSSGDGATITVRIPKI